MKFLSFSCGLIAIVNRAIAMPAERAVGATFQHSHNLTENSTFPGLNKRSNIGDINCNGAIGCGQKFGQEANFWDAVRTLSNRAYFFSGDPIACHIFDMPDERIHGQLWWWSGYCLFVQGVNGKAAFYGKDIRNAALGLEKTCGQCGSVRLNGPGNNVELTMNHVQHECKDYALGSKFLCRPRMGHLVVPKGTPSNRDGHLYEAWEGLPYDIVTRFKDMPPLVNHK